MGWEEDSLPCTRLMDPLAHPRSPPAATRRSPPQVQDSEVDEDGEPPKHCQVTGATRAELTGYLHKRISQSRCKAGSGFPP